MRDILIIKTSSLGDVVHNMPAVTDIRQHFPDTHVSWLVEEDYAPLVARHPGVDRTMVVATRRWRRRPREAATWREMQAFLRELRAKRYDVVIDTQGLARTALLARLARGDRHGYDLASIRERFAAPFYAVRHAVGRKAHAIERNRSLVGKVLGYIPEGEPDYGLERGAGANTARLRAVLLHGTAQAGKQWPERSWIEVGAALEQAGFEVLLAWGTERERLRSEAIARGLRAAQVPPLREPLDRMADLLSQAALVVGLDTGLAHLAAAFGVPLVAIFVGSDPGLTGPRGRGRIETVGARGQAPDAETVIAAIRRTVALQSV